MDKKTYETTRDREFRGRKVRTLIELSNGWCRIPPGTVATVEKKSNGLSLFSNPCPSCGVRIAISHVSHRDVDFVDQPRLEDVDDFVDLGNGWLQYNCRICKQGPFSALKDSLCGKLLICTNCSRKASISETLKRISVIDDPIITEALKEID